MFQLRRTVLRKRQTMEYFDLLNEDGSKNGRVKERNAVHRDGDLHASTHIWMKSGNKILLQRRAWDKESRPGCLDAAAAGHVSSGEEVRDAARREIEEETGIKISSEELAFVASQRLDVIEDNGHGLFQSHEINSVFAVTRDIDPAEIHFDPVEVAAMEWKTPAEIETALKEKERLWCIIPAEWKNIREFYKL